jgi:hypothetical protein
MSLYEPTTRRAKLAWAVFTVAAVTFTVYQYVRFLIETA